MSVEDGMRKAIEQTIGRRLARNITSEERERILRPRALMGYEAILDYLSDQEKTQKELEEYLQSVD